ncbi:phosphotransferase enzyme family protein [Aspergillus avenaceus]|uniref:Phosphotransferase enzyme family protein n=1 Tax=Aspergillus avenaceus TaxID=36643 RepID=A0A5N6U3N3_ASPAV|nr:phosphotransferase enzyme family protein [Aspergillus avenaceus]
MACEGERVQITQSKNPSSPSFVVEESSFFQKWGRLPSPNEVQARAKTQHLAGAYPDQRTTRSMVAPYVRPPPVIFEEMGLFVKWGSSIQVSEAQCLYAVRQLLKGDIPVPEVYGWRTEGDEKYIYMEYVNGTSLEQAWPIMGQEDKASICRELRTIYQCLRQVEQDPEDPFIGNVMKEPLYDRAFHVNHMHEAGPFTTVHDFHDWFTFLHRRPMSNPYSVPVEPFRHDLPDNCAIKFTHGDLHRSNIIDTTTYPYRILAVVDWEQSGWLPEYWESRKAQYTADRAEPWSTTSLPMILDQYTSTWDAWDYYIFAMGC